VKTPPGYLIVPGIGGSDDEHWQSLWETVWAGQARRIEPASWAEPELGDWVSAIDRAARQLRMQGRRRFVVVAHSLGCWAAAEWVLRTRPTGTSAYLVAVPDGESASFPRLAAPAFVDLTAQPLGVPALVVASDDDPYCSVGRAAEFAEGWGADWRSVGSRGHLNSASGLANWPEGQDLLAAFVSKHHDC
jgi:predicted alpha/beta hydrolase family esterase